MALGLRLLVLLLTFYSWYGELGSSSTTIGVEIQPSLVTTEEPSSQPLEIYACNSSLSFKHTCNKNCDALQWDRDLFCHCDPLCIRYGDCCRDYELICGVVRGEWADNDGDNDYDNTTETSGTTDTTTPDSVAARSAEGVQEGRLFSGAVSEFTKCVQTTDFDPDWFQPRVGHYMVALCPNARSIDSAIRTLCHGMAGSNIFAALPVDDSEGIHYKNVYCALCHGIPLKNLSFWSVSYGEKHIGQARYINANDVLQAANRTRSDLILTWVFNPPGPNIEGQISPHYESSTLRSCVVADKTEPKVDACSEDLCQRYAAPVTFNRTTFKNLACARCNYQQDIDTDMVDWCRLINYPGQPVRNPFSLATLLVFSDRTNLQGNRMTDVTLSSASCGQYQLYDPFLNFCRNLICPDGFTLKDGKVCVRDRTAETTKNRIWMGLNVTGRNHGTVVQNQDSNALWKEIANEAVLDYFSFSSLCQTGDGESVTCDEMGIEWTCSINPVVQKSELVCGTGKRFVSRVHISFTCQEFPVNVTDGSAILLAECFQDKHWNFSMKLDYYTLTTSCGSPLSDVNAVNESQADNALDSVHTFVWDDDSGRFSVSKNVSCMDMACPLTTLSSNEYVASGALNESIRVLEDDRVLHVGEFMMKDNGEIDVCISFLQGVTSEPDVPSDMWGNAHSILTISGSVLSLISLVVTTATYVAFATLRRNAAGKALMCLVASLFFAQLTMLIGLKQTDIIAVCTAFGIGSHFFWLSAFCWMNVLAIDIYRTFGIGTKIRVADPKTRSFIYYALYGLGAPALIVGTCVIINFCDCVDVDVHYASELACWIGNGMTNLLAFGVPIIAILCSNVVLFSLTVAGIVKTRRATQRMNITQGQSDASSRARPNLILYMKLTVIMGFTWIFGFIASFSGVQFFWFPFIVLNSLQGALVCLAFVCNQRVIGMWKTLLRDKYNQRTESSIAMAANRSTTSLQTSKLTKV